MLWDSNHTVTIIYIITGHDFLIIDLHYMAIFGLDFIQLLEQLLGQVLDLIGWISQIMNDHIEEQFGVFQVLFQFIGLILEMQQSFRLLIDSVFVPLYHFVSCYGILA